jgi:membrane-associated protease RseP (regulator of RpoE activity)
LLAFNGVNITGVTEGAPADLAVIHEDVMISSVNGVNTTTTTAFVTAMSNVKPGETVELGTKDGTISVETTADPNNSTKPYLGVFLIDSYEFSKDAENTYGVFLSVIVGFERLLFWIAFLNLGVGIMNFLPIWALDGSRILYDLTGYVIHNEKVLNVLMNIVFGFFLILLLFNVIGPAFF